MDTPRFTGQASERVSLCYSVTARTRGLGKPQPGSLAVASTVRVGFEAIL